MLTIFSPELLAALIGALVGAIAGAIITFKLTRWSDKLKLTLDFHKEWNGSEMSKHRRLAHHCIKRYPDTNYNELSKVDENGSISLFIILRFYERLWQCFNSNSLNKQITANLFYDN